jgi:phage/plasmid-associated DNA primase
MKYMASVDKRLFIDPLGAEVADYWLLNLARGLAGDLMKRLLFGLGSTDCGKSTITTACKNSLGGYFGSFNGESLAYRNCSQDEASQMRWVMLLRYKRLIFSNEMKSTVELNGNMIKKISSGGDSIIGRNHGNVETDFVPQFLTVCMANDINKIKPYDKAVSNRTRVIPFNRQFVEEPSNEFQLKKDLNITDEMETPLFQRVFVGLLIRRYMKYVNSGKVEVEPAEVVLAKNEWIGDENEVGFVSQFLTDFEITNNVKDFVPSSYIDEWLKHKNLGVSMKCFGAELKKHCIISKFTNVSSKDKKINGKNVKAWFGIKKIRVVYDSPSDCIDDDNATEVIFQEV